MQAREAPGANGADAGDTARGPTMVHVAESLPQAAGLQQASGQQTVEQRQQLQQQQLEALQQVLSPLVSSV